MKGIKAINDFLLKTHYAIDRLAKIVSKNTKINLSDRRQVDDEYTLFCDGGNLATTIEIVGFNGVMSRQDYVDIINNINIILQDYLLTGYQFDLQWSINNKAPLLFQNNIARQKNANENMNLGLKGCIEATDKKLSALLNDEKLLLTIYTSQTAVNSFTLKKHLENLDLSKTTPAGNEGITANLHLISSSQRQLHKATVEAVVTKINLVSSAVKIPVEEVLQILRGFATNSDQSEWSPITLKTETNTFFLNDVNNKSPEDASIFLPPPLASQILPKIQRISNEVYKFGDIYFSALEIVHFPIRTVNFESLRHLIVKEKISAFINFKLLPDGYEEIGGYMKQRLANFSGSFPGCSEAGYIGNVLKAAKEEKAPKTIQCDISFFSSNIKELEKQQSILIKHLAGWGGAMAEISGDSLMTIISSLGLVKKSAAPKSVTNTRNIAPLLPLNAMKKPFEEGNILLRTLGGAVYPLSTEMIRQSGSYIIYGAMGFAKSVFVGTVVKSVVNDAALNNGKLPKIAFLDIAKSPSGIIPYLKNVVDDKDKADVSYIKLTMNAKNYMNPLDTILGVRVPIIDQLNSLSLIFEMFTISEVTESPKEFVPGMLSFAIKKAYEIKAEKDLEIYLPRINLEVDEALEKATINIDKYTTWWDIVDYLFDNKKYHIAEIAQRYAVPIISDIIAVLQGEEVRSQYQFTVEGTGEASATFVSRKLAEAINKYPILNKSSTLSSGARISYLNLIDVAPKGDPIQTTIMYLAARMSLVKDWALDPESLFPILDDRYKSYYENKIESDIGIPKVIIYDESHRTGGSPAIQAQMEIDVREGPKYSWFVVLSTQQITDISPTISSLATTAIILGGANEEQRNHSQKIFGLTDSQKDLMKNIALPSKKGAELVLWLNIGENTYVQKLVSTLSSHDLWILSSDAIEAGVRDKLYKEFGVEKTIDFLAEKYPSGSLKTQKNEIQKLLQESPEGQSKGNLEVIPILYQSIKEKFKNSEFF